MRVLSGVATSPGIAMGPAFVYRPAALTIIDTVLPAAVRADERATFQVGRARASAAIRQLADRLRGDGRDDLAAVFDGHAEILADDDLGAAIEMRIMDGGQTALAAIRDVIDEQCAEFLALESEYFRQRADDIRDIGRRLLRAVSGIADADLGEAPAGSVIIAEDLVPSETAQLDPARVAGFVIATGGRTSHVAIMARTLEVPAVVGCPGILEAAEGGAIVALDGATGTVSIDPDPDTAARVAREREVFAAERDVLARLADLPAITTDGYRFLIAANVGTPADAEAAVPFRPDGVGLFRTEFLFMNRSSLPDEDEQARAYAAVAKAMAGRPVIIRTLDVGGDKPVPGLGFGVEENPFLGWRGARLFVYGETGAMPNPDPDMRRQADAQIGAILRAATAGDVWMMFPMIATVDEVLVLRALVEENRARLGAAGIPFGPVKLGIMVETPAAALIADKLAEHVDFFSIGSNDLTQYTLAADRGNDRVAPVYQPFHPALWRLFRMVAEAGKRRGIPVGLCGELAGMEEAVLPLMGLGLDEFSMAAPSVPRIKRIVRAATILRAEAAADRMSNASSASEAFEIARASLEEIRTW